MKISTVINKFKTGKFWIMLFMIVIVIALLILSFNVFIRNEYKVIGNRSIYLGSNKASTMLDEMMQLEKLDIQDEDIAELHNTLTIDVFRNKQIVDFYGHQADIYYVFWEDRLVQVYFLIGNHSIQERENTCSDIHAKLQNEYEVKMAEDGAFQGYPKKFDNVLLEKEKDFHSWLWRSGLVQDRIEPNNVYTRVEYGKNYLPTDKELWHLITGEEYESLMDENTAVIEYCFWQYKGVLKREIESFEKADG